MLLSWYGDRPRSLPHHRPRFGTQQHCAIPFFLPATGGRRAIRKQSDDLLSAVRQFFEAAPRGMGGSDNNHRYDRHVFASTDALRRESFRFRLYAKQAVQLRTGGGWNRFDYGVPGPENRQAFALRVATRNGLLDPDEDLIGFSVPPDPTVKWR